MSSIHFSLRYLSKARGSNITRIVSLTLGLCVSILVFSYVSFLLSFDKCYPDYQRIHQVWLADENGLSGQLYAPFAPAIEQDMPQVEAATRTLSDVFDLDVKVGEEVFDVKVKVADTSFFDVFGFQLNIGDDPGRIFNVKGNIMISRSLADAMFPGISPVGQTVIYKGEATKVIAGVFEDPPYNTSLGAFNVLVGFDDFTEEYDFYTGWDGGDSFPTYIKMKEGTEVSDLESALPAFLDKYQLTETLEEWKIRVVLKPIANSSFIRGSATLQVWILSGVALLMLIVATMNYVLISVSGLVQRSRTIALLKCNGAHKSNIFNIFLSETAILLIVSLLLSALLIVGLAGSVEDLSSYPVKELFALRLIWAPISVLTATFLLAGLIPARLFTSVPIQAAFKGMSDGRRIWKRTLLGIEIVCVTIVVSLLIMATKQFVDQRDMDLGYEHDDLLVVSLSGNDVQYERYLQEINSMPEVRSVGLALSIPAFGYSGQPCYDEITREMLFGCRWEVADSNFIPTMGMEIIEGSNFNSRSNALSVIVNEEYVRLRGWTDSPIGKEIADRPNPKSSKYTIVGVVKDFKDQGLAEVVLPIVIHTIPQYANFFAGGKGESYDGLGMNTFIRLHKMSPENIEAVAKKIREFPSTDNHKVRIYNDLILGKLSLVKGIRNVMTVVSLITLLIAMIGLIGYLNDEINRRSKEIAIRKVNGATANNVLKMLAKRMLSVVLPSICIGLTAAFYVGAYVLYYFDYSIVSWTLFVAGGAGIFIVVYLIQTIKTWRIANMNPSLNK